jgi:hypothetical protein
MKKLFYRFCHVVLFLFLLCSGAGADGNYMKPKEVSMSVSNKTYKAIDLRYNKQFHVYFSAEGRFRMIYESGTIKNGKWSVNTSGDLCLTRIVDNEFQKKCGKVKQKNETTLLRYDNKGRTIFSMKLAGDGNLLKE